MWTTLSKLFKRANPDHNVSDICQLLVSAVIHLPLCSDDPNKTLELIQCHIEKSINYVDDAPR